MGRVGRIGTSAFSTAKDLMWTVPEVMNLKKKKIPEAETKLKKSLLTSWGLAPVTLVLYTALAAKILYAEGGICDGGLLESYMPSSHTQQVCNVAQYSYDLGKSVQNVATLNFQSIPLELQKSWNNVKAGHDFTALGLNAAQNPLLDTTVSMTLSYKSLIVTHFYALLWTAFRILTIAVKITDWQLEKIYDFIKLYAANLMPHVANSIRSVPYVNQVIPREVVTSAIPNILAKFDQLLTSIFGNSSEYKVFLSFMFAGPIIRYALHALLYAGTWFLNYSTIHAQYLMKGKEGASTSTRRFNNDFAPGSGVRRALTTVRHTVVAVPTLPRRAAAASAAGFGSAARSVLNVPSSLRRRLSSFRNRNVINNDVLDNDVLDNDVLEQEEDIDDSLPGLLEVSGPDDGGGESNSFD